MDFSRILEFAWRGYLNVKNYWRLFTRENGAKMLISAFRSRRSISGPEMDGYVVN